MTNWNIHEQVYTLEFIQGTSGTAWDYMYNITLDALDCLADEIEWESWPLGSGYNKDKAMLYMLRATKIE